MHSNDRSGNVAVFLGDGQGGFAAASTFTSGSAHQVEVAADDQDYVEDCIVCCRPIALHVARDDDGSPSVSVAREAG